MEKIEAKTSETEQPSYIHSRKTSLMWQYFTVIDENVAKCKYCEKDLRYRSSTSNLKKHLRKAHPSLFQDLMKGRILFDSETNGATEVAIDETFEDLDDPFNENDEEYSPQKKMMKIDLRSDQKNARSSKLNLRKPAAAKNSRFSPVIEFDQTTENDEDENEFELLGKYISSQLRRLTKVNAFLAQEEIQSVLTRYKVHELSTEEKSKMMTNKL
ncbi:uncharacterized protein LOC111051375 [Nilaparvata lugens]|uniref:uncharacterized protein LOC111051375 n=1 Tax=Nilaparvata lugens TaxID=108931 RepID=UPI00193D7D33|nr:uncharacterized protein LOC111051375 [Nilaparvata lugens]